MFQWHHPFYKQQQESTFSMPVRSMNSELLPKNGTKSKRERDEQIPIYRSFVNFKGQISAASARWFWVSFTIYLLKC